MTDKKSRLLSKPTRFRAYQLGSKGSSFSYYADTEFTLIEARITDVSRPRLRAEMKNCSVSTIGCLHITSWDDDHCAQADLEEILADLKPKRIEYPGYTPHTETGKSCRSIIKAYTKKSRSALVQAITPSYINALPTVQSLGYSDVFYNPKHISPDSSNDNSTVKLFRSGCFNVVSLGDVESPNISAWLRRRKVFNSELDVMILAHHGADNGFTSSALLRAVKPSVAVCSSNYDNQFDHPAEKIRELLHKYSIPLYTTKTGDIVVESIGSHKVTYRVVNLISGSTKVSSERTFTTKKSKKLAHNLDTVRNTYAKSRSFVR